MMTNNKLKSGMVSVFTVNWNGKKWLKKYLQSVQKQTYKNIEIIIVDNNSSDGSVEYIEKYFPKVKIIKNKKNFGLAKATQIGVNSSSGEFVLFINNDTWFDKNLIENFVRYYKENEFTVLSAEEKRYFDNKEFKCNTTIDPTGSPAYFVPPYSKPEKIFYLTVCFFSKKNDFINSGGTDEDFFMYYEDVDWFWRLTLFGKKFAIAKNCVVHHAGAGSTGSGIKYEFFLWRNQNALQMLIKNYSLGSLILFLPIYFIQNIFEILFFLITLKPKIAYSYLLGWTFNLKHLKRTLNKRRKIQRRRQVGDFEVYKKMYIGPSKLRTLLNY
ncbi:MAG: glycosyltransferase [Niabella sp.]|nr:MAG: glycosyltransferase [Niabella sp.]